MTDLLRPLIFACLAIVLALAAPAAIAQQSSRFPPVKGFAVDPVETFDENENYLGDVEVTGLKPEVLDRGGGMLKVKTDQGTFWVYESDVNFETKLVDCQALARAGESAAAATMGLGCKP